MQTAIVTFTLLLASCGAQRMYEGPEQSAETISTVHLSSGRGPGLVVISIDGNETHWLRPDPGDVTLLPGDHTFEFGPNGYYLADTPPPAHKPIRFIYVVSVTTKAGNWYRPMLKSGAESGSLSFTKSVGCIVGAENKLKDGDEIGCDDHMKVVDIK